MNALPAPLRDDPRPHERLRVALIVGGLAALYAIIRFHQHPDYTSDLDHLWYGARALVHGQDPYQTVGPGRLYEWAWPIFYPLPAILLLVPFSFIPVAAARIVFSTLAGGTLGFALGSRWRTLWPMFISQAYYLALSRNQWSPFMLAAFWLPSLGFVVAAKPNVGIVALAAQNRRTLVRVALLAAALVAASFVVRPGWLGEWLSIARTAPNKEVPILQPGGFLLLGALLVWRTFDARVLLASVLVPQTPSVYDLLPLFALCRTTRQALVLALLTHALQLTVIGIGPYADFDGYYKSLARLSIPFVFVPVMLLVLRNHGRLPGVWRRTAETTQLSAGVSASSVTDRILFIVVTLVLGVQLWIYLAT